MIKKKNIFIALLSSFIIIISVFIILTNQTQKFIHGPSPSAPVSTPTPPFSKLEVFVDNLQSGDKVKSPLKITGTIDSSWIFEASFPVSLYDDYGHLMARSPATVIEEWASVGPKKFEVTLNFKATTSKGYLEINNDNPSGLPENQKSYKIPVLFK